MERFISCKIIQFTIAAFYIQNFIESEFKNVIRLNQLAFYHVDYSACIDLQLK